MSSNQDRIDNLKRKVIKINSVSPTFCTAKWLTSTTTLYNGFTHSCHHPSAHKINLNDLDKSPTSLHNTPVKIAARQDMLDGIQTKECDYCWNIENLDGEHFSDRHYKTASDGRGLWDAFDRVVESKLGENINPSYLEVAFENTCNFKCTYCSPDVSSKWMDEVQRHGGYPLANGNIHHDLDWQKKSGKFPIHYKEDNPYINKFWEWWPELYKTLNTFRITGGEPLLSENTWKILDYIIDNPNPNMDLKISINTNMGIPRKLVEKLIEKVNLIQGKCRDISIFTSAESTEEHAEYSRFGMDWELYTNNIKYFMDETAKHRIRLSFMTTVDIFASASFDKFLEYVCGLRKTYDTNRADSLIGFHVAYLRWPHHQQITLLDAEQKKVFGKKMADAVTKLTHGGPDVNGNLYMEEIDQINRLVEWMNSETPAREEYLNFVNVFEEMDRRRSTNLLETFPHLQEVYNIGNSIKK
jgi:pyruvate-formate lyase-activating enzyme